MELYEGRSAESTKTDLRYLHIHTCMYVCVCMYIYLYMHVQISIYACLNVFLSMSICIMQICMSGKRASLLFQATSVIYACIHVILPVCMYIRDKCGVHVCSLPGIHVFGQTRTPTGSLPGIHVCDKCGIHVFILAHD